MPPNLTLTDAERIADASCNKNGKTGLIELILASKILNGLSRYEIRHLFEPESLNPNVDNFNWRLKDAPKASNFAKSLISKAPHSNPMLPHPPGSNFVTLHQGIKVNGYAWYAGSASDYLATAAVCVDVLIAISHTVLILSRRSTSNSWGTATELLALALQSPAATALFGSGAGIERVNTYRELIKLRDVEDDIGKGQGISERLTLVPEPKNGGRQRDTLGATEQLSDGLKQTTVTTTAVATPSISSAMARNESQANHKESHAIYRRAETDKKYL